MKNLLGLAVVAALAVSDVSAHYIFQQLSHGSTQFPVNQYVRKNTNYNSPVTGEIIADTGCNYPPLSSDMGTDLASNDLRCNVGATGAGTETVAMKAGDSFTFTLDIAVYHQGPISLYEHPTRNSVVSASDGQG